ncbi:MAG: polysaccharide biosynthesis C-terminal domain-containing protein, partial [Flavobacteriales bacterium]|nr:polysaccharide biosynthesis C-terminal domain-containing protein [Flavobacteriales bacterium]
FLMIVFAFTSNLIFIPKYQMIGAAVATALSSIMFNILKYLFIWKRFGLQPFDKDTVIGMVLIIAIYFAAKAIPSVDQPILDIAIHSGIIGIAYFLILYLTRITPELFNWRDFLK